MRALQSRSSRPGVSLARFAVSVTIALPECSPGPPLPSSARLRSGCCSTPSGRIGLGDYQAKGEIDQACHHRARVVLLEDVYSQFVPPLPRVHVHEDVAQKDARKTETVDQERQGVTRRPNSRSGSATARVHATAAATAVSTRSRSPPPTRELWRIPSRPRLCIDCRRRRDPPI